MSYPVFEEASTVAYKSATDVDVSYPATVNAGDLLWCCVICASGTWSTPSGWTVLNGATTNRMVFWKEAAGTESGTLAVAKASGSSQNYGLMYRWSGQKSGSDWLQGTVNEYLAISATVSIPNFTDDTTDDEILCASVCLVLDNNSANNNASNYTERDDQLGTPGFFDSAFHLYTYQMASAGKPGTDSYTMTAADIYTVFSVGIAPASAAGYANDVNGVAAATIAKINGVATANIAKVSGV